MIALVVILVLMLAAYLTFAVRYYRHSPWRATWQGITLLAQKLTMSLLVGFFIFDTIANDGWPGRFAVLISLLGLLLIEAWATLAGLLHVQRASGLVSKRKGEGYVEPEDIKPDTEDASENR